MASVEVSLDAGAYSVEAVHRAAYALMATMDVRILTVTPELRCVIGPVPGKPLPADADLRFRREVTDHELRILIEARTAVYRDLVLGLAFSKTGLQGG